MEGTPLFNWSIFRRKKEKEHILLKEITLSVSSLDFLRFALLPGFVDPLFDIAH